MAANLFTSLVAIQPTVPNISTSTSHVCNGGQPKPIQGVYSNIRTLGVQTK